MLMTATAQFDNLTNNVHRKCYALRIGVSYLRITSADSSFWKGFAMTTSTTLDGEELDRIIDNVIAHLSEVIRVEHNLPRKEALLTVVDSLLDQRTKKK